MKCPSLAFVLSTLLVMVVLGTDAVLGGHASLSRRHPSRKHMALLQQRASRIERRESELERSQQEEAKRLLQKQIDEQQGNIDVQHQLEEYEHYLESLVGQALDYKDPNQPKDAKPKKDDFPRAIDDGPSAAMVSPQTTGCESEKHASGAPKKDGPAAPEPQVADTNQRKAHRHKHPKQRQGTEHDDASKQAATPTSNVTSANPDNNNGEPRSYPGPSTSTGSAPSPQSGSQSETSQNSHHESSSSSSSSSSSWSSSYETHHESQSHQESHGSSQQGADVGSVPEGVRSLLNKTMTGRATFYTPGLGACGGTDSEQDKVVAVSQDVFEKYTPNGNPNANTLCGLRVRIKFNGKAVDATVRDECPTCKNTSLDLSPAVFNMLEDPDKGIMDGMEWSIIGN